MAGDGAAIAGEGFAGEAANLPFAETADAEGFVEIDGGLVPVEDAPIPATAAASVGEAGEVQGRALPRPRPRKPGFTKSFSRQRPGCARKVE
jgi:hypothetical protein